jgi:hypothetical protein
MDICSGVSQIDRLIFFHKLNNGENDGRNTWAYSGNRLSVCLVIAITAFGRFSVDPD